MKKIAAILILFSLFCCSGKILAEDIGKYKFEVTEDLARNVGDKLDINFKEVSLEEFMRGLTIEQEHSDITKGDPVVTGEIAIVHLEEIPDYYTRLDALEENAKRESHE